MSRLLQVLGVLVVLAAGAVLVQNYVKSSPSTSTTSTSSSTTSSTTTTLTAALCLGSQFTGVLQPGQGAAGTIFATVELTNSSSTPCTTNGWPALDLFNAKGSLMKSIITESDSMFSTVDGVPTAPSQVTVDGGTTLTFELAYSDVPVGSQTVCPTVNHFVVHLPDAAGTSTSDTTTGITVAGGGSFAPCGQTQVWVSPLY